MNPIVGIGVDIVQISRIKSVMEKHGERFISRVFTKAETKYSLSGTNSIERFAGRFAVKEAVMKALGTGKSLGITWHDIETVQGLYGKPEVRLYNQAIRCLRWKGGNTNDVHVSIAHDGGKAIAFVILSKDSGETK